MGFVGILVASLIAFYCIDAVSISVDPVILI